MEPRAETMNGAACLDLGKHSGAKNAHMWPTLLPNIPFDLGKSLGGKGGGGRGRVILTEAFGRFSVKIPGSYIHLRL